MDSLSRFIVGKNSVVSEVFFSKATYPLILGYRAISNPHSFDSRYYWNIQIFLLPAHLPFYSTLSILCFSLYGNIFFVMPFVHKS